MFFEGYHLLWNADLYDQRDNETKDVDFLLELIGGNEGLSILEAACGTGRIMLPLVRRGYRVTGIDVNNYMLSRLFAKSEGTGGFAVIQGDAVEADWGSGYDLVILAGDILLNIQSSRKAWEAESLFVHKAYAALKPGGHLFMDNCGFIRPEHAFNRPGVSVIFSGADRAGVYGRYMLVDAVYDIQTQSVSGIRRWELTAPGGETFFKEEPYRKPIPSIKQMEEWLRQAGFVIEHRFGDYSRNPVGEDTCRAIYWARKP
jgi:SAM-dependent methyltransferase